MINENDDLNRRCPKLGHEITFKYCREPGESTPCKKIADCWFEKFDVISFLKENYPEDVINKLGESSKPKTLSLFELMEQAKQRKKEGVPDE